MNLLIEKQNQIKADILEQQKKIFYLENQLMDIEQELTTFSDNVILDHLQLSEQQQQIIDATEDNILVVACPGSGKTHTLISGYVKLILNDHTSSSEEDKIIITPEEVLLITFTKKAGMEMLNRLNKIVPNKLPYHVGSLSKKSLDFSDNLAEEKVKTFSPGSFFGNAKEPSLSSVA